MTCASIYGFWHLSHTETLSRENFSRVLIFKCRINDSLIEYFKLIHTIPLPLNSFRIKLLQQYGCLQINPYIPFLKLMVLKECYMFVKWLKTKSFISCSTICALKPDYLVKCKIYKPWRYRNCHVTFKILFKIILCK